MQSLPFAYSRGEHLLIAGGLLLFDLRCPIPDTFCCPTRPEYATGGPMLSGGVIFLYNRGGDVIGRCDNFVQQGR